MRNGLVYMALFLWAAAMHGTTPAAQAAKAETLARWQFVGTRQLSNREDLQTLRDILALPATQELRSAAIESFARNVASRFTKSADTNANSRLAALIKPLLPDLIENESRFELSTRGAQSANWYLALKLPAEKAALWSKNLADLASSARMQVSPGEKSAWSAERDNYRVSFTPADDWLILEGGSADAQGKAARKPGRLSGKQVLNAELDLPALARLWSSERLAHAPKLTLSVLPRNDGLRSEMLIEYPEALGIKPEKWNPPTALIHDPLVGFTAIQGIAGRLAQNPRFKALEAEKTPNQAFFWSQSTMVFTMFAAADVGNPGTVISNIVTDFLPKMTNLSGGRITVLTNRPAILWRGLPVVVPFIEAADEGKSPYLVAGLFPVSPENAKPAPRELFGQLDKKNLVYYDWEITQERLKQWRPTWQFAQIVRGKFFAPAPSDRWIEAITPKLGNTITEVTLENPRRLKLVRQSQSGFTALELVLLAHALDPNDVLERAPRPVGQQPPARRSPAAPKR